MASEDVSAISAVASELEAVLSNVFGSQISLVVRTSFNGRVQVVTRLNPEFLPSSRYFEIARGGVRGTNSRFRLVLRVGMTLEMSDSLEPRIKGSMFALCVLREGAKTPVPLVRVEYVRAMRKGPHCHIHIHASSSDWDLVTDPRSIRGESLSEIHIPLGSRHFRPSLEEFLYFLDAEGFYRNWAVEDLQSALEPSLNRWYEIQTMGAVRDHPQSAIEALEGLGYRVKGPSRR
ncbi:MAG: hypothetical protein ACYC0U_02545 [Ilumatobacteraceae bacterium]